MKPGKRNSGGDKDSANGDKTAVEVPSSKRSKRTPRPGPSRNKPEESGSHTDAAGDNPPNAPVVNEIGQLANFDSDVTSDNAALADLKVCLNEIKTDETINYVEIDEEDDEGAFPALAVPLNEGNPQENSTATSAAAVQDDELPSTSGSTICLPETNGVRIKLENGYENDTKPIKGLDLYGISVWVETQNREFIRLKQQLELQTVLKKKAQSELKEVNEYYDEQLKDLEQKLKESECRNEEYKKLLASLETKIQLLNSCTVSLKEMLEQGKKISVENVLLNKTD